MGPKIITYLWNIFGVNAVYWIAHVLFGGHYQWEGKHARGRHAVVQTKHPAVNVHVWHV